jgi:hypothetical protein
VILTAGVVERLGSDEARVRVAYFRSSLRSALPTYRVVREDGAWVSLGPILRLDVS